MTAMKHRLWVMQCNASAMVCFLHLTTLRVTFGRDKYRMWMWPCGHQLSYFHACRRQICQFQLVPVRSSRLVDRVFVLRHPLNWKSPHHARKRKETREDAILKTRDMFQPSFSKAKYKLLRPGQSGGVLRTSPSRKNLGFSVWNNGKQGQCAVQIWLHCP